MDDCTGDDVSDCGLYATCANTDGSYACPCDAGYSRIGHDCQGPSTLIHTNSLHKHVGSSGPGRSIQRLDVGRFRNFWNTISWRKADGDFIPLKKSLGWITYSKCRPRSDFFRGIFVASRRRLRGGDDRITGNRPKHLRLQPPLCVVLGQSLAKCRHDTRILFYIRYRYAIATHFINTALSKR